MSTIFVPFPILPRPAAPPPFEVNPPPKFQIWKEVPLVKFSFRPTKPIYEMTQGLMRLQLVCDGTLPKGKPLEERVTERVSRWSESVPGVHFGEGTYSRVRGFEDRLLRRQVAGKLLKIETDLDLAEEERRMLHFCQPMRHVIRFYGGAQVVHNKRYSLMLMMEKVPSNLFAMWGGKKLPFEEVIGLCQQLLEFHVDASAKRVVHCDLSIFNMAWENKKLTIYDFGLARFVPNIPNSFCNSLQSLNVRAPEILAAKTYDESIDLWSIGCIVYACFMGKHFVEFGGGPENEEVWCKAFAQIVAKIGMPPDSYFKGSWLTPAGLASDCAFYKDKPSLREALGQATLWRGAEMKGQAEPFIALLQEIFKYNGRISPTKALELCNQIKENLSI